MKLYIIPVLIPKVSTVKINLYKSPPQESLEEQQEAERKEMEEKKREILLLLTEIEESKLTISKQEAVIRRLCAEIQTLVNTQTHLHTQKLSSVQFCLIRLQTNCVFYRKRKQM